MPIMFVNHSNEEDCSHMGWVEPSLNCAKTNLKFPIPVTSPMNPLDGGRFTVNVKGCYMELTQVRALW